MYVSPRDEEDEEVVVLLLLFASILDGEWFKWNRFDATVSRLGVSIKLPVSGFNFVMKPLIAPNGIVEVESSPISLSVLPVLPPVSTPPPPNAGPVPRVDPTTNNVSRPCNNNCLTYALESMIGIPSSSSSSVELLPLAVVAVVVVVVVAVAGTVPYGFVQPSWAWLKSVLRWIILIDILYFLLPPPPPLLPPPPPPPYLWNLPDGVKFGGTAGDSHDSYSVVGLVFSVIRDATKTLLKVFEDVAVLPVMIDCGIWTKS
mmetsp:Transcript_59738/g.146573  ORF Transcript_59738/g.146573 Transcript_59738/m.146573 type:complete len:259 (-) Transcript_59738:984-1760(-)